MKKGLSLFLSVLLIAVSFCACGIIKDDGVMDDYTYVDSNGNTHQYETNTNGEIVTQNGGEKATTSTKSNVANSSSNSNSNYAIYATDKNGDNVTDKNGELVTTQLDVNALFSEMSKKTTTTRSGQSNNSSGGIGGNLENSDKNDLLDDGDKTNKTNLKATVIDPVVKSNKYTLDMTIVAQGMEMPMVMCINGKDYAASISMEMGIKIDARVFSKDGKYYIVIPMLGMYSELNEEDSSDIAGTSGNLTGQSTYVKSTKVKDGNTTYTCEEYKSKSGDTVKYYFNEKGQWKRWEVIDKSGGISVFKINSLKNTVDKKMFEIPKYLQKVDYDKFIGA